MAEAGEPRLPTWAVPYLPDFRRVLHAIELSEGFVLFPIEVPGPDVAHALAKWLEGKGHPTRVVEPEGDDWSKLVESLFASPKEPNGVLIVIGDDARSHSTRHVGLRLLNQRRDALASQLQMPLLWCGPKGFLDATWRDAPDFWSVADVPRRIKSKAGSPMTRVRSELVRILRQGDKRDSSALQYKDALAQGDWPNAVRIGLSNVEALMAQGNFQDASALVAEMKIFAERGDPTLRARVHLLGGKLALSVGNLQEAESELKCAVAISQDSNNRRIAADAMLALGNVFVSSNRLDEAKKAYDEAYEFYAQRVEYGRKQADTLLALGDYLVASGSVDKAEAFYRYALEVYAKAERDPFAKVGSANALLALGELYANSTRFREAEANYSEALSIYESANIPLGKGSALALLGDLYATLDRFEDATETYEHALSILRDIHAPQWEQHVTEALEAVRVRPSLPPGKLTS